MKIISYLLISISLFLTTSCYNNIFNKEGVKKQKFLSNHSDIPLFKDFEIVENETLDFDSPSGNISNITYRSSSKIEDIVKYYQENLPNFGWKEIDKSTNYTSFSRGGEILKISYDELDGYLDGYIMVKFFIVRDNV